MAMRWLLVVGLAAATVVSAADKTEAARAELRAGRADAAIEMLRQQIAKEPAEVDAALLLGHTLLRLERFDEADEVAEGAAAKNPSDARVQCLIGDLRYREGRVFDADKAYKAAIKLDPKNARAMYGISRVFRVSCLRKRASEVLQVAHALDSADPEIETSFYLADRRSPVALERMKAALARRAASPGNQADPRLDRLLRRWVAEAEALEGKPECEPSQPDQPHQIPLHRLMDGSRVTGTSVGLKIENAYSDLRFDTGASGILVSNRFAEHAGIRRLADTEMAGIGNGPPIPGWVGYAPRITIGGVEFNRCIVEVTSKGAADDSGGLLGSDIFRRFLVKINLAAHSVDLDPLPGPAWDGHTLVDRYDGPELAGYSQALVVGHHVLIPTMISESKKAEQTSGMFLFDTGAGLNMISTNLAPAVTKVRDSEMRVRGVSGKVKNVYRADQVVLQFANFRQLNLDLASFDLTNISRGAEMEVSGIIGLPLIGMFESVTLDYRDGRVKFNYKR